MKRVLRVVFLLAFLSHGALSFGQTGRLVGSIIDEETGENILFANLLLEGTDLGVTTDLDGNYAFEAIPVGTYNLRASYIGYNTTVVQGVEIKAGETKTLSFALGSSVEKLGEIVVEARKINNTANAILAMRKKSINVSEGISSEEMNNMGSSNAAESMKSVTGVSIENGKYMVVRGLGDRYSVTQLNNITLPSADPYRNSASMDLIPSDMVDNIVALKTFTPDQPGSFTGGMVDITSKSYPEKFYLNFKTSAGYNTNASLNENFQVDGSRGKTDWLGIDDGTREQSEAFSTYKDSILTSSGAASVATKARRLNGESSRTIIDNTAKELRNSYLAQNQRAPLNHSVEFSVGDKVSVLPKLIKNPIGYNLGVNYGKSYSYYDDGVFGLYDLRDGSSDQLVTQQSFTERKSVESPQFGGIFSLAYQFGGNNEIALTQIYNHDASITNQSYNGAWVELGGDQFDTRGTVFKERAITSTQLSGKHIIKQCNEAEIKWIGSRVVSTQNEPDIRYFGYTYNTENPEDTNYILKKSLHDLPTNFYRDLRDLQYNGKVDFKLPILNKRKHNDYLKIGHSYATKSRVFNEERFEMNSSGQRESTDWTSFSEANGDLDIFLSPDNAGVVETVLDDEGNPQRYWIGNYYSNITQIGNSYEGRETITGTYAMMVYSPSDRLQLIGGARLETTDLFAESMDTSQTPGEIQTADVLPSLNAIYRLTANSNLRLSATQTLARPNMREISPFASVGGIGAPIVLGNPELTRTLISNFDFRYELFPRIGEVIAVSTYYKDFTNPIVWQLTPVASTAEIKPINVDRAIVYGAELEFRKNLSVLAKSLSNFTFNTNFSYIYSRVDKSEEELAAIEASNRPDFKNWRPFQGQSPYIINAGLTYKNDSLRWRSSLSFNMFGPRLAFVTDALTPDIYEQSRPSLNFVTSKQLGKFALGFKVFNILDMTYLKEYEYSGNSYAYERFRLGRTFSLSVAYKI